MLLCRYANVQDVHIWLDHLDEDVLTHVFVWSLFVMFGSAMQIPFEQLINKQRPHRLESYRYASTPNAIRHAEPGLDGNMDTRHRWTII